MIEKRSIEELLEIARVEDVVGQFTDLSQRGSNRKAACPFCGDAKKFGVSVAKQIYKCHGCGEGGNSPLKFLQHNAGKRTGMDFRTAIQWLADHYRFTLREEHHATETGGAFDDSYFRERMAALRYPIHPEDDGLFRARTDGGIEIRYPDLYEGQYQQEKGADFVRIRLHPSRQTPQQKYSQPSGTGFRIFIPPVVVREFRAGVKWECLWVVEGEFKAYALAQAGVPVVGIAGIKLYIAKKGTKDLHPDLVQLLRNATSVSLVHDADSMQVRWNPTAEPDKDLATRRRDFAGAVTGFRRAVGSLVPSVHYQRIKPDWLDRAKGLDDLAEREGLDRVTMSLQAMRSNTHFEHHDLSTAEWREINGIFHLNMHRGVPRKFYDNLQNLIGTRPFVFLGGRYQFVEDEEEGGGKLEMLEHPDSRMYLCVAGDFFKKCWREDEHGRPESYLAPWKESFLMRNYVRNGVPRFLHTLDTYDGFTDVPGHHEDYRAVVVVQPDEYSPSTRLLNRYRPLPIQPRKGEYPTIINYLKHVFGEEEVCTYAPDGSVLAKSPRWVVYLDRWTLMYRQPYTRVPACVLGSTEHNTGKTTLLELNLAMWGANAVKVGNEAISDTFNSDWIRKKYVGVDETLLAKQADGEKFKGMITGSTVHERGMYAAREKRTNFTTFDLTTNHPDKFLPVGEDDMRWWVVIVPQYKTEDPFLLQKMIAELPALFYDLRRRDIVHPQQGRLWFANSVIETMARKEAAAESRTWVEKDLRAFLEEQFYAIQWPELYYSITDLKNQVNETNGARYKLSDIRNLLKTRMKHTVTEYYGRVVVPKAPNLRAERQGQNLPSIGEEKPGRWWVFRATDWVKPEQAAEFLESARTEWRMSDQGNGIMGPEDMPLYFKDTKR